VLGSSGADAVECALKTALLSTGRPGVIAFEGAYHGLSLGALDATWRSDFREPFRARLPACTDFARYGDLDDLTKTARRLEEAGKPVGAVIVEPIQGRGGERVPPTGFLAGLRERCDSESWLLIVDEIYTGCGRTGRFFACEHEDVIPDLICVGKGLSSGMPLSACLGRAEVMDAWPISSGEALHTQTFLGHPASCAAALAALRVIERDALVERAASVGARALERLQRDLAGSPRVSEVRGRGLMLGIACTDDETALATVDRALDRGVIVLPSGEGGRVISITPPLSIAEGLLDHGLSVIIDVLGHAGGDRR
jgi:4-aminobutyrate aminotransferase/(S)-3-amino-2-methylpropionate transaminase